MTDRSNRGSDIAGMAINNWPGRKLAGSPVLVMGKLYCRSIFQGKGDKTARSSTGYPSWYNAGAIDPRSTAGRNGVCLKGWRV